MRYTDLILKDFPIAVYPLDETISGTSNLPCYSVTDTSTSQDMQGVYVYNSGWKVENKGLPLVLGGKDSTYLLPNNGSPSLKVPRLNCFSSNSIYTDSTFEFWLKVKKSTNNEVKILGVDDSTVPSSFGLYVYKNYLIFKLDEESFISAPIQTWNSQHHIALVYSYSGISLLVDGIKYYPLVRKRPDLPFQNNKNFVFYGSSELGEVVVDAIAIYKYGLTEQNAKRHMVYALGFNFSGSPFVRNNGVFSTFENANSKKIDDFLVPMNQATLNFEAENVIIGSGGIQLFNTDKIYYINNTGNTSNFYFSQNSYLQIDDATTYLQDNFGIGIAFSTTASIPSGEEQTILFIDGSDNTGDVQVLISNNNILLRIYSIDKTGATPPYYQKTISTITHNTNYLFALSMYGNEYKVFLNDSSYSYTDLPPINLQEESSVYIGALGLLSDTETLESFFEDGIVSRVTLFKNIDEFSSVINATSGNLSRFNSYYQNMTITFDKRIRLYRKGYIGLNVGMDQFGKPLWNGTVSRSSCGGIKLEHLYPSTDDPEITITINQFNPPSNTSINTQIVQNQIEMLNSVDHNTDLTDRWMTVDVDFDSDDCLYFPPVLGQILFTSMASTVSSESIPDYDVSLDYINFEGTVKLKANDSKPTLDEFMLSAISLGELSGVRITNQPVTYTHTYSSGSNESLDNLGIKTLSLFVKRNSSDITKKILSWTAVAGTTAPTTIALYKDGEFYINLDVSSKNSISWSDTGVLEGVWTYLTLVFNTPLIYKNSTKQGPEINFGDSSGVSNLSIQHLGICENSLSSAQIESVYKIFSGENKISTGSQQSFSIYETPNGVQLYTNNWQIVS